MTKHEYRPQFRAGSGHRASCSCGWAEKDRLYHHRPSSALAAWTAHVEASK